MARRFTITLPDGTIAKRSSKSNDYTHGVVTRIDNHARAVNEERSAEVLTRYHAEVVALVTTGDLSGLARLKSGYSIAAGYSYSSVLPWAATEPLWVEYAARFASSRTYIRKAEEYAPWLPDWMDAESWAKYSADAITRMAADADKAVEEAARLRLMPRYSFTVVRWSMSLQNAMKATSSTELGASDPTMLLTVQPVD